jgi:hypothetical protein
VIAPHTFGTTDETGPITVTADIQGSSSIFGGSRVDNAGMHAENDANLSFTAVPTPSASLAGLAMFGLLAGGQMVKRRRHQAG